MHLSNVWTTAKERHNSYALTKCTWKVCRRCRRCCSRRMNLTAGEEMVARNNRWTLRDIDHRTDDVSSCRNQTMDAIGEGRLSKSIRERSSRQCPSIPSFHGGVRNRGSGKTEMDEPRNSWKLLNDRLGAKRNENGKKRQWKVWEASDEKSKKVEKQQSKITKEQEIHSERLIVQEFRECANVLRSSKFITHLLHATALGSMNFSEFCIYTIYIYIMFV